VVSSGMAATEHKCITCGGPILENTTRYAIPVEGVNKRWQEGKHNHGCEPYQRE